MNFGFDYDQTLDHHEGIQSLASMLIKTGMNCWIITSRAPGYHNQDIYDTMDRLGFKRENLICTSWEPKVDFIEKYLWNKGGEKDEGEPFLYFDNDPSEIFEINERFSSQPGVLVRFTDDTIKVFQLMQSHNDLLDMKIKDKF